MLCQKYEPKIEKWQGSYCRQRKDFWICQRWMVYNCKVLKCIQLLDTVILQMMCRVEMCLPIVAYQNSSLISKDNTIKRLYSDYKSLNCCYNY